MKKRLVCFLLLLLAVSRVFAYDYVDAIEKGVWFFDANRCGPEAGNDNVFSSWRGACHTSDSSGTVNLTGGYHDAGDHVKFGLPQFWSAATLGWTLYEYRDFFDSHGLTDKTLSVLKYFTDFILKCHPNPNIIYYEVGEGGIDHGYWGPPESQTGERPVKSAIAASDVCGEAAAALALMYLNYGGTYGQQCLDAAVSLLNLGLNNIGRSDGGSFYPSSSHYDDLSWGSIWVAIATGDDSYLDPIEEWMDWEVNDYNDDNYNKEWAPAWDDVTVFALLKLGHLTGNQKFIDGVINNLTWYRDECQRTPYGLPWLDSWGVLRYASSEAGVGYLAHKLLHWDGYVDTAALTMDYCLGDNPRNSSYVTNYLNNAPEHPHHRANEPNKDGVTHGMVGALVGGPNNSDNYTDNVDDYTMNEVAIDYNASFLLGMAGRAWIASGATPAPTQTPVPTAVPTPTPIPIYGDVKVQYQAGDTNDTTSEPKPRFIIVNDSTEDIPFIELAIRYFMTKDRYREDLILNYDYVELGSGNLDTTEHEGYIQVGFLSGAGILEAGTTSGEIQLHMGTSPQTQLDQTNDYSFDPSYSSGFEDYIKVALYRGADLIWGTDPVDNPDVEPTSVPTQPPEITPDPGQVTVGDVDGDESIDIVDALLVAQYYVGLNPAGFTEPVEAGDVDCDEEIDIIDGLLIAQTYVGLDPAAWCGD